MNSQPIPEETEELAEFGKMLGEEVSDSNEDEGEGEFGFGDFLFIIAIGAIVSIIGLIAGIITWIFASFMAALKFVGLPVIVILLLCWWRLNAMENHNEQIIQQEET